MRISHRALVIAKGSKIHGLYILKGSTVIAHASVASVDTLDITKLWHLRLGHVSERGLVKLAKQGLGWVSINLVGLLSMFIRTFRI